MNHIRRVRDYWTKHVFFFLSRDFRIAVSITLGNPPLAFTHSRHRRATVEKETTTAVFASTNSRGCGLKVSAKMRSSREITPDRIILSAKSFSHRSVRISPPFLINHCVTQDALHEAEGRRGVNGRWNCDRNTARTSSLHGLRFHLAINDQT